MVKPNEDERPKQCPFCKRKPFDESKNSRGFKMHQNEKTGFWQIICPCGVMTKLCGDKMELLRIWNMRSAKPWKEPVVNVTHKSNLPKGATDVNREPKELSPDNPVSPEHPLYGAGF